MNLANLREGRPECPSDLALDRLHAGELEDAAVKSHVQTCATCAQRAEARARGFAAVPIGDSRRVLAGIRSALDSARDEGGAAREWIARFRKWLASVVLVAAAAIALVVLMPTGVLETRLKGGPVLRVFRLEAGKGREVVSGELLTAGDQLRFVVSLPREGYVAVIGREANGALFTAWPQGAASENRAAANALELPGAVALDASAGDEMLFLVQCPEADAVAKCASDTPRLSCPDGCQQSAFAIRKRP